MKNKILIILSSFLLFACVLEFKYSLSDPKDAVVLNELVGNYLSKDDSAKVEFKLHDKNNIYNLYFRNENDSLVEHHKAFLSIINETYFLNFSTINQLKSDQGKELYQFYKVYEFNEQRINLLPVSDSLFKEKEFESKKEFRDYFKSNLDNSALYENEKENQIQLKKIY
jgi:hypothetical protein